MAARLKSLSSHGFTLIELLAVLVFVSLLFGVVLPQVENFSPVYLLRSKAREVATVMAAARTESAAQGKDFGIRYDFPENRFGLLYPADFDVSGLVQQPHVLDYHTLGRDVRLEAVLLPDGKRLQQGVQDVWIRPTTGEGSHIVVLRIPSGRRIWIKYNGLSGVVTFSENRPLQFYPFRGL